MRKRVERGVLALAAIGVLVFVLSQPRKGSVAWHIREYKAAQRELNGERRLVERSWDEFRTLLGFAAGPKPVNPADPNSPWRRRDAHWKALTDSGYVQYRELYLMHVSYGEAYSSLTNLAAKEFPRDRVWRIRVRRMGMDHSPLAYGFLPVDAEPRDMAKWEEMVRRIDVPKNGERRSGSDVR